jgi:hypothetical protein
MSRNRGDRVAQRLNAAAQIARLEFGCRERGMRGGEIRRELNCVPSAHRRGAEFLRREERASRAIEIAQTHRETRALRAQGALDEALRR